MCAQSICTRCGNSDVESETWIDQNSAQDFSQVAYWSKARTTAAARDCWGLPQKPTGVMLLMLLEQQGHQVQLRGKDRALIFKTHSNDSWGHVLFSTCLALKNSRLWERETTCSLASVGSSCCPNVPFPSFQTDLFQFVTPLLILLSLVGKIG